MAEGKGWVTRGLVVALGLLAACSSGETSEPVTCVGSGHVSVCSPGESDSRWLSVQGARPSTAVSWTIDGETKQLQVPNSDGPLRIDLPARATGTPIQVTVSGTDLSGQPFSETVTTH
jgi:hypothetical protein